MPRDINVEYAKGLIAFQTRLELALIAAEQESGKNRKPIVDIEQGRKFDKVRIFYMDGDKVSRPEVRYFVEQSTGIIYGMKSDVAPNPNQYQGTVYTADKWDWSGERAVPLDEEAAGVKCVGTYGDFKHYIPVNAKPKADKRTRTGKKLLVTVGADEEE